MDRRSLAGCALALLLVIGAGTAHAESAWIKGEVRLNLRTGPGTQYRIVSGAGTGDAVTILQRGKNWTQVRLESGKEGWIPEGYLEPVPPPTVRLMQLEAQVGDLQAKLDATSADATQLRDSNEQLSGRDGEQQAEIESLSLENLELKAGARWPEWITGSAILVVGMLVGAALHRNSARRPSSRIRI